MKINEKFLVSEGKLFNEKAIKRSGLIFFNKTDMLQIIDYCIEQKWNILGFDGFFLHEGNKIQPSMEHSIDFTDLAHEHMTKDEVYKASIDFIANQDDRLVFEIVAD